MLSEGIQLLQVFEEYKKKNPHSDLADFGKYLSGNNQEEENLAELGKKMPFPFPADSIDEYLGWIWGRLVQFTHVWEKKALAEESISNSTEFGILLYVLSHPECSKSEVANHTLQENSTIFETIKRLIKSGMLVEKASLIDRRAKSLILAEKGKFIAFSSLKRMKKVSQHLMAPLSNTDKKQVFDALIILHTYHKNCWEKYENSTWEEMEKELLN
jgi:DNA-binding MarR family transcriptional regulator